MPVPIFKSIQVLGSQLLLHKPENPREFLLHELKRMREDPGRQDMTKSIFTEKDLETSKIQNLVLAHVAANQSFNLLFKFSQCSIAQREES